MIPTEVVSTTDPAGRPASKDAQKTRILVPGTKGADPKTAWALRTGLGLGLLALLLHTTSCLKYEKVELRPELIPGASYVGMSVCEPCYDREVESFKGSSHAQLLSEREIEGQACEFCHGPGSLHFGVKESIINPARNAEPCFRCHMEKRAGFNLQSVHPVAGGRIKGRVGCSDCHRLHGSESAAASLAEGPNDRCFRCHREQQGPTVWEHDAVREGCISCHNPHGSINNKLLVSRPPNPCASGVIGSPPSPRAPVWEGGLTGPTFWERARDVSIAIAKASMGPTSDAG